MSETNPWEKVTTLALRKRFVIRSELSKQRKRSLNIRLQKTKLYRFFKTKYMNVSEKFNNIIPSKISSMTKNPYSS